MDSSGFNIILFNALFRGREDVFAKRWETKDKSGYAPAYDIDWNQYSLHKASGGTLKDYPHKSYSKLTEVAIIAHLEGKEVVGIYPLLENNTSWFLAIDFDENNWRTEIIKLFEHCSQHQLPSYIERSRSGNGGHLWMFFEQPCPAIKSRAIIKDFLKRAGVTIKASNSSSFDRIFPNQDQHTGKGLGNLIALPFQKAGMENGNCIFINPDTFDPYPDQWGFLSSIQKVTTATFDNIYAGLDQSPFIVDKNQLPLKTTGKGIQIFLDNKITISRDNLPSEVVLFLRENLKTNNPNFFIRKATGQNTFGIASSSTLLEEQTDRIFLPRGYIGTLLRHCKANKLEYQLTDQRTKLPDVKYEQNGRLYDYQQPTLAVTDKKEMGVIVAPPGSGKTIIGLSIIAQKKQPALIIVHRRQLLDQWIQRIQSYLGIPKYKIGRITKGQVDISEHITVAMIQSLCNAEVANKIGKVFGTIIIDECHHLPSDTYKAVLQQLHTYYLYGLTATPIRKNKDEKMIFAQIGEVIHEIAIPNNADNNRGLFVNIRDTDLDIPFNAATDNFETLSDILVHDTARNSLIADDIRTEINNGKSIMVLTERKAHIEILNHFLKQDCETITLSGDDTEVARKAKMRQIEDGRFQVLITTGQFMGEGIDIGVLDCLFLVYPCSFEGKLIQYIGRVQRSENVPAIYDYRDLKISYLEKMFQKRNKYYNKLANSGIVKTHEEYFLRFEEDRFYIGSQANAYPISLLELGMNIDGFQKGIVWKIRVLKYKEEESRIFAEILNYNVIIQEDIQQLSLSLLPIEQIRFRTIDTGGILKSVVLKRTMVNISKASSVIMLEPEEDKGEDDFDDDEVTAPSLAVTPPAAPPIEQWWVFDKIIKIPFKKIGFGNGCVTIPFYLSAIRKDITIEIPNDNARPEFEAIKEYFSKILKTKSITVSIRIKHDKQNVLSYEAASDEVNAINGEIIDSLRFEFVRRDFKKFKGDGIAKSILSFDDLKQSNQSIGALLENEAALLNEVLKMESAKHYLQIKYLAAKHEASILKLRFILQPFSFIFLIAGENKYHLIWETLDSEEATYLWHIAKDKEALRAVNKEIETSLSEMKLTGRNSYIKKAPEYFSRIIHDYSDTKKGFVEWKGVLEERLV